MNHVIRNSEGFAHTYLDREGIKRQGPYIVRIICDCGFLAQAPVDEIDRVWSVHLEIEAQ